MDEYSWTGPRRVGLSRRRALQTAAGAGVAVAAACGGKRVGTSTSKTGNAGTPRSGGRLNVAVFADFNSFDNSTMGLTNNATALAYDSLLGFQQGANVPYTQFTAAPRLAERWETAPDAATFTFHLRNGVKFANLPPVNGRALTSDDVKWSYEYFSRTGNPAYSKLKPSIFGYMFEGLDRIDTPDAQTVVVRFKEPFGPFLSYVSIPNLPIMPHEIFDQDGTFDAHMVGSGPFQLDTASTQTGAQYVFKKNPSYWNAGRPYLDEVRCLVLPDNTTQQAAFQTKQIDILSRITDPTIAAKVKSSNPDAVVQQSTDPNLRIMWLQLRHPPFPDVRLRKAVSLALDRDELIKVMTGGMGEWAMPDSLPDMWTQAETKSILVHDPAQAKQLVAEAGYPNGLTVELMYTATRPDDARLAQLIQAQLKNIGINITILAADSATFNQKQHTGDFQISLVSAVLFADLDSRYSGVFLTGSGSNYAGVSDPKLDDMIRAQRREPDPAKRRDLIKTISRYLADNYLTTPLYRQTLATFWHPNVKNYADNWVQLDWNAPNVWLSQ